MTGKKSTSVIQAAVLALAAAAALVLRTIQYFTSLESFTGFFKEIDAGIVIFYAVIAAAFLFFLVSSFARRKSFVYDSSEGKRPGFGILSCLLGVSILISTYQEYTMLGVDTSAYTVSTSTANAGQNLTYIICLFGLISAVYFIAYGVLTLTGKSVGAVFGWISLAAPLWCVFRLVVRFTRTISYMRVSDLLLEMLALCSFCIFLMSFIRLAGGVNPENCEWKSVAFGLTGAMLGIICFIPRAIMTVSQHSEVIYILSRADVSDLAMALFMLCFVFTRIGTQRKAAAAGGEPASIII